MKIAVLLEQAIVGGALPIVAAATLHHVLSMDPGGIVLQFVNIDEAALRKYEELAGA